MPKIITATALQKNIGKIAHLVSNGWTIITSRGKAKAVLLPYFDDNDASIEEYLEDYEMHCNGGALKKRYSDSMESGVSNLVV